MAPHSPLQVPMAAAGEERSPLYSALLSLRRNPNTRLKASSLFTVGRIAALALCLLVTIALVMATRHPPVQVRCISAITCIV